jgi:cold shock CspA family protein
MSQSESVTPAAERLTGMVKWFNSKSGFGFITVCGESEFSNKDIFVHYSAIRVANSQYKYLVQGEYVEFNVVKSDSDKHEFNAADITGVKGGAIMCETRKLALSTQPPVRKSRDESSDQGFSRVDRPKSSNKRPPVKRVVKTSEVEV